MILFFALLIGYFLGSIPFGLLLSYMSGYGDIRKIGSGNIGATNVLRTGNKFLAFLTLILDALKGAVAVFFGSNYLLITMEPAVPELIVWVPLCLGIGAILGHCFPVWLKFHGGKGVATAFGTILWLNPAVGGLACATWLVVALLTRYSSLSALAAIILTPFTAYYFSGQNLAAACLFVALLVITKHRANIGRLLNGEEPRIGKRS